MIDLNNKSVLVTGGTGSFGRKFVEIVLKKYPAIKRLVIFSRDELKQYEMAQVFPPEKHQCLCYMLGDVRDRNRLSRAFEDIDYVIHAAALKQVPAAEYNPMEYIKTNVLGAENVIDAALENNVKKVVALSTDKATAPIGLYGATKLCADKLFVAANNIKGKRDVVFSVVRYGNVIGSRGSVVPFFLKEKKTGILPLTDINMTRFNISLEEEVDLIFYALEHAWGGELFIPKLASFHLKDLAKAICPDCEIQIVGLRAAEKIHEDLISEADAPNTFEFDTYFVIAPSSPSWKIDKWAIHFKGKKVPTSFKYNSKTNDKWLSVEDLRDQIKKYVEPDFLVK